MLLAIPIERFHLNRENTLDNCLVSAIADFLYPFFCHLALEYFGVAKNCQPQLLRIITQ
jgi:hypothetical protein